MKGRGGFSLIELLVALVLLSFAMLLLFRGVEAVTETVMRGRRQSQMHRSLNQALRLLQEDLEQMVFQGVDLPPLICKLKNLEDGRISFALLRQHADPELDVEFVEYRIVAHPEISGLFRLIRASAPLLDWGEPPDLTNSGEILVDELIGFHLYTRAEGGQPFLVEENAWLGPPANLDLVLALTYPPFLPVAEPDSSFLLRLQQFDGIWGQIRVTPRMKVQP